MKSLENRAEKYDKGILRLTLGKYPEIQKYVGERYLQKGKTLLDLGMGTGNFAIIAAQQGVDVVGVDTSEKMIAVARKKIKSAGLTHTIKIRQIPIINLDKYFEENTFDFVSAMFSFSELYKTEQDFCFEQVYRVLKEDGIFIMIDEVSPQPLWKKAVYYLVRFPITLITYLKTHLMTKPITNLPVRLKENHFSIEESKNYLLGSLGLFIMKKTPKRKIN